jgi:hypothetical protein
MRAWPVLICHGAAWEVLREAQQCRRRAEPLGKLSNWGAGCLFAWWGGVAYNRRTTSTTLLGARHNGVLCRKGR